MSENEFSYVEVDKNLIVTASIRDVDLHMYDVRRAPFELYGMYRPEDEEWFVRMPEEAAASVSEGVLRLSKEPTGGRIRFSTNSPCVAIRAEMCAIGYGSHYPLMEAGAFDLYVDTPEGSHFERPFTPPYGMKEGYEQIIKFRTAEERFLTINFPVHARVKNVWVGVAPGSTLGKGLPYSNQKPVVFLRLVDHTRHGYHASGSYLFQPSVAPLQSQYLQSRIFGAVQGRARYGGISCRAGYGGVGS